MRQHSVYKKILATEYKYWLNNLFTLKIFAMKLKCYRNIDFSCQYRFRFRKRHIPPTFHTNIATIGQVIDKIKGIKTIFVQYCFTLRDFIKFYHAKLYDH